MIETARISSPVGPLLLAAHEGRLVVLAFAEDPKRAQGYLARRISQLDESETREAADPAGAVSALHAYFGGDVAAIDRVPADPGGGGFMLRAWEALRRIPAGQTISYTKLAVEAGSPHAVRAAGTACATNPIALVIPCHRVVRSDGKLGGYGGGLDNKVRLLDLERRALGLTI